MRINTYGFVMQYLFMTLSFASHVRSDVESSNDISFCFDT